MKHITHRSFVHSQRMGLSQSSLAQLYPIAPVIRHQLPWHFSSAITGQYTDHTWADDSCIVLMAAVVHSPAPGRALPHMGFLSSAVQCVQQDGPWSCPKVSRPHDIEGSSTAQLPAHHAGIVQVPAIITDGAPGALVKDLHSPGAGTSSVHQAELSAVWGERNGTTGHLQGDKGLLSCGTFTWAVDGALLWGFRVPWFWQGVVALGQHLSLVSYSSDKRIITLKMGKNRKYYTTE